MSYSELPENQSDLTKEVVRQVEINVKYSGYIKREQERIEAAKNYENQLISPDFDSDAIKSLRLEAAEKLKRIKPENLGQASRISGVNPSDVSILSMFLKRNK